MQNAFDFGGLMDFATSRCCRMTKRLIKKFFFIDYINFIIWAKNRNEIPLISRSLGRDSYLFGQTLEFQCFWPPGHFGINLNLLFHNKKKCSCLIRRRGSIIKHLWPVAEEKSSEYREKKKKILKKKERAAVYVVNHNVTSIRVGRRGTLSRLDVLFFLIDNWYN